MRFDRLHHSHVLKVRPAQLANQDGSFGSKRCASFELPYTVDRLRRIYASSPYPVSPRDVLRERGFPEGVSEPLSICDVVAHAGEYRQQRVLVRGLLASDAEQNVIYDPNCHTSQDPTYVSEAPELKKNKKLNRLLGKDHRAWVVVVGVFHGPEVAEIDPKLPQWIKDRLTGTLKRYGHLATLSTMIEVSRILKVESVTRDTPWE